MSRKLNPYQYQFLKGELNFLQAVGKLSSEQVADLLNEYEVPVVNEKKEKLNVIPIILIIGAILIGLSILSFVASNWLQMSSQAKYLLLLGALVVCFVSAKLLEVKKPVLAKVLYYIGSFAYGGEIFYIGQLFHLGGSPETAFLMWGLGVLPLAFYRHDTVLKFISLGFIYLYLEVHFIFTFNRIAYLSLAIIPAMFLFGHFMMKKFRLAFLIINFVMVYQFVETQLFARSLNYDRYPIFFVLAIPVLFYIGHKLLGKSQVMFAANWILVIQAIVMTYLHFDVENYVMILGTLFVLGLALVYVKVPSYKLPMKAVGIPLHFITAIILTVPWIWKHSFHPALATRPSDMLALAFGILYGGYTLTLLKGNSLLSVVMVSIIIFRYYVDMSMQFLNKSLAFLIGGVLLISLGIWFERTRRGGKKDEMD